MVIRPKSMATVVVFLASTPLRSSRPTLAPVMGSSVRSGRTSLIAPTRVVLPAPKPPAMRILNAVSWPTPAPSEGAEPMQYLPQQVGAGLLVDGPLRQDGDPALHREVGQQHADHPQRERGIGCQVGHRSRLPAQAQDLAVLGDQAGRIFG